MPTSEHFHGVVAALQPVLQGMPDVALGNPTPCAEYDVRALAGHLLGTTEALRRVGAGESLDPQDPWGTGGRELRDGWRHELGRQLTDLADAWVPAKAWEGDALDGAVPRALLGRMAYVELLVHGWDLAVASDQGVELTRPQIEELHAILEEVAEEGRSQGAFGPRVPVPDDASLFDRALGLAGRDPDWSA